MRYEAKRRAGVTLIELLVVMGILGVLLVITVTGAMRGYQWVQRRNSELTLEKVNERMQRRYEYLVKEARLWPSSPHILLQAVGNPRRAEIIKLKYLVKWSFPMNYVEAEMNLLESQFYFGGEGYPSAVALVTKLRQRAGVPVLPAPTTAAELNAQNSACLAAVFETVLGSLADELDPSEVRTVSATDANRMVIDSWGTPLFYFRYGNMDLGWMTAPATVGRFGAVAPLYQQLLGNATNVAPYGLVYPELIARAAQAFPARFVPNLPWWPGSQPGIDRTRDVDDAEGLLALGSWRNGAGFWWMPGPLALVGFPGGGGATQGNKAGGRLGFGIWFPATGTAGTGDPRLYCPLVIMSAGLDRRFTSWDDNLDSYRFLVGVAGQ